MITDRNCSSSHRNSPKKSCEERKLVLRNVYLALDRIPKVESLTEKISGLEL